MSVSEPSENPPVGISPSTEGSSAPFSPEDLPPVEPPSAGFILQLFVVPAVIVGVILGVWALFRMSASSDYDWERQIGELRQENEHRRWRGANSLVQMLQADARAGEQSQNLRANPDLAEKLGGVLREQVAKGDSSEENRKLQAYLIIALGWLDAHDATVPLLIESTAPSRDPEVRQNALTSLAMIAGREFEAGGYLDRAEVSAALLSASQDADPKIRQLAVYTLGLLAPEVGGQRVRTMLEDSDDYVRVNAAIALARGKSSDGLAVLESVLKKAVNEPSPIDTFKQLEVEVMKKIEAKNLLDPIIGLDPIHTLDFENKVRLRLAELRNEANAREIELRVMTLNALQALLELAPQLSASERARVSPLVDSLADDFRDPKIIQKAQDVRQAFR